MEDKNFIAPKEIILPHCALPGRNFLVNANLAHQRKNLAQWGNFFHDSFSCVLYPDFSKYLVPKRIFTVIALIAKIRGCRLIYMSYFEFFKKKSLFLKVRSRCLFVAFCSFFPSSLTVFHRGRQQKSRGRQWKSSRADKQHCFP